MNVKPVLSILALGAMMFAATGCATQEDLEAYAKKSELASLRAELMQEIRKAQDSARAAEENSAASATAARQAAGEARDAANKADAIFRKSVRK